MLQKPLTVIHYRRVMRIDDKIRLALSTSLCYDRYKFVRRTAFNKFTALTERNRLLILLRPTLFQITIKVPFFRISKSTIETQR